SKALHEGDGMGVGTPRSREAGPDSGSRELSSGPFPLLRRHAMHRGDNAEYIVRYIKRDKLREPRAIFILDRFARGQIWLYFSRSDHTLLAILNRVHYK